MINSLNKLFSQKSLIRKMARRILPRLSPSTLLKINTQLLAVNQTPVHLDRSTQVQTYEQTLSYSLDLGFGIPFSKSPKVSIVIPVLNNWWTTYRLLQTLRSNNEISQYEVIVVDDGSTDLTSLALSRIRGIKVISLDRNVGYLRATNLGASYAKGEFIALLNNDTEPLEGWLDGLVEAMEKDHSIGLAGSNLMSSDGKLQESGGQIFKDGSGWNLGRGQSPLQPEYMFVKEVDYCSAAAIMIRNSLWNEIGGFDERFVPAYYEDTDLAFEVRKKGFKVVNIPSSVVLHVEGVSHGKDLSVGLKSHQVTNSKTFVDKWAIELSSHWKNEGQPRIEHTRESLGIVILVDRQFPAEFRDSGSIRTIRLAKSLDQLGYHVIIFADDASTTTLDHQKLRNSGIETHHNLHSLLLSLEIRKSRVRFVWLIRSEIIDKYLVIFEESLPDAEIICDLLDLDYVTKSNRVVIAKGHTKVLETPYRKVLVSPYEVNLVKDQFSDTRIHALWKPFKSFPHTNSFENRSGCLFVGGFRHTPNVEGIKWFANEVIPHLRELGYSETVRVVGTGLDNETEEILEKMGIEVLGGVDDKSLSELYSYSKIAIIPLLSGRGLKGKFAEAASHNLPIVSTPVGAEGFNAPSGYGFWVSDNANDFAQQIFRLTNSLKEWEEAQTEISKFCEDHLSHAQFLENLQYLLRSRNLEQS